MAVLSLTTFGNVMKASFIAKMLPVLRATAAKIEAAYVAAVEEFDETRAPSATSKVGFLTWIFASGKRCWKILE